MIPRDGGALTLPFRNNTEAPAFAGEQCVLKVTLAHKNGPHGFPQGPVVTFAG